MLKHHTNPGHVFRDMVFGVSLLNDGFWLDMILLNLFYWIRAWEVFSRLGFCTVIIVIGKTCLQQLRGMSSLQDMWNFLFISMTGTTHSSGVYSASWFKPVLGLVCLHLNTIGWSGHVTSRPTIRRDNSLRFMSLWLGFKISAYGQGVGSSFRFSGSVCSVRV